MKKLKSPNGLDILLGTNAKENNRLTLSQKRSNPANLFFHASDVPGSHVVLVGTDPSREDIIFAAKLAAKHSKSKKSTVRVDYCPLREVCRDKSMPIGMVELGKFKTIKVTI